MALCLGNFIAPVAPLEAQQAPTQSAEAPSSSLLTPIEAQKLADNVLKETSTVRGLRIKKMVPCSMQSRAATQTMLQDSLKKSSSSNEIVAMNLYLKQLKLAPANFDLPDYYLKMMDEQLAGYFDARTDKFYTTSRVDRLQLQTVMAHELTHALQDQHFDLSRLEKWPKHDSDARLALQSLVEGDATLAMMQYTARNPFRSVALLASTLLGGSNSATFTAAPLVLQDSLTFPYVNGMTFVSTLHKRGGWPAVNKAFHNLPASTEQILHPEKFLANEKPVLIPLRDITRQLGRGWKLLDHDVNGEFGLYITLKAGLKDQSKAQSAASGWAGDRLAIYQGPNGANLITQVTLWDNEEEARNFAQTYQQYISQRLANLKMQSGALLWRSATSFSWLERRGKKVIIFEGTSSKINPAILAIKLWN